MKHIPGRRTSLGCAALCGLFLILTTCAVFGQDFAPTSGTVNDSRIRMRDTPDLQATTVEFLSTGDRVEVLGRSDKTQRIGVFEDYWYKVRSPDGKVGWTFGAFIDLSPAPGVERPEVSKNMVPVGGGTFMMGAPDSEQESMPWEDQHKVTVSSFHIGKFDVTQDLYQSVMGNNPSLLIEGGGGRSKDDGNRPVEYVSWYEAVEFCNKLSRRDGLQTVYTINGTDVTANWSANGYRLPTEAEWEYAARGGQKGASTYHKYAGSDNLDQVGWYSDNSGSTWHPVGQKAPNALGLYDMSGNVWQWCWDWYGAYSDSGQNDPRGASSGTSRTFRGGSWYDDAAYARVASRSNDYPTERKSLRGFRLVRQ
jgi:formylglycine-generating enzyme required for sulfatase activity